MKTIPVLYEDEYLVAFEKPAGVLVIPAPGKDIPVLTELVNQQMSGSSRGRLHPCHRLDQFTSGAILYAKGKKYQQIMMDLFHKRKVGKIYIAFAKGQFRRKREIIRTTVLPYYSRKSSGGDGQPEMAVTRYEVLNTGNGFTVLRVFPETGRTNQIRIHFAEKGHPLLGERIYAYRKDFGVDMKRLALHSSVIRFRHPVTRKPVEIRSELPEDMREFLRGQGIRD